MGIPFIFEHKVQPLDWVLGCALASSPFPSSKAASIHKKENRVVETPKENDRYIPELEQWQHFHVFFNIERRHQYHNLWMRTRSYQHANARTRAATATSASIKSLWHGLFRKLRNRRPAGRERARHRKLVSGTEALSRSRAKRTR